MEVLTIEVNDPKAKRLLDDLADLGLISIKDAKPAWNERWEVFSKALPDVEEISEQDIFDEIAIVRSKRHIL